MNTRVNFIVGHGSLLATKLKLASNATVQTSSLITSKRSKNMSRTKSEGKYHLFVIKCFSFYFLQVFQINSEVVNLLANDHLV